MTTSEHRTTGSVCLARLNAAVIDPAEVEAAVSGPQHGAVVVFTGKVRDHDGGQSVSALEYSAHPEAERFLRRCCADAAAATGLPVAALHRVGALAIGEIAIAVAVASPHRAEAFRACAELVDRIKHEVPIWKRQHFADGVSEWVNACG
ncbi:molybdenum cofactor biosynthesis protein MoaE [Nocardia panacis]|uniref:Molybdenum cofactor biosynthesis protein MoaE n=1 Tax=Nocardia panacis TaxID=2340916 RepID=A0A3A4KPV6_9NOCA|nr:molybdenum cofactor biosynthesis protein MoaE [Nocardia panacis]RJO75060.1 molybdenum cofactor biosynthesis protein MoaE [Nocardia panacis]